jgi:signal transduction histidine kinase
MAKGRPLPDGVEERLVEITELVATAIVSSARREQLARLADEQAALRRVATLVARGAPPADVFDAVAEELGGLLEVGSSGLVRFADDRPDTVVAGWGRFGEVVPDGDRPAITGRNVVSEIARTGRSVRGDDVERTTSDPIAGSAGRVHRSTSIGGPIVVAGRLWGALVAVASEGGSLPPDAEPRLAQFIELVGTAIANAEAQIELTRMAHEQAALRRVATLVAEEAPVAELFAKVAEEVAGVSGERSDCAMFRYEPDDTATVVAVSAQQREGGIRVGLTSTLDGTGLAARVFQEGRPIRVDDHATTAGPIAQHARRNDLRAAVGCPILVDGRLWGAMVVAHQHLEPFPPGTEKCVAQFTELVATAIANAEARAELRHLAQEQAALRRVATLVAEAGAPTDVFDAVVVEVAQLLRADQVGMMRAEESGEITVVAQRGQDPRLVRVGMRLPLDGASATSRVLRTARSTRLSHYERQTGTIADIARRSKVSATVGAPITVESRIWGVITASWEGEVIPPVDAEERLAHFAELVGTAIANADSHDQLTASRVRVLSAGDEARRRVVRDLHDGAQQRLVHTILMLKLAQRTLGADGERTETLLAEALDNAEQSNAELRELAHGILPSALTRGGLRAGVRAVVSRLDLPVYVEVTSARLPDEIEASAYFIIAESLTNVAKHARATRGEVTASIDGTTLRLEVRDDGVGGADPQGHGLLGMRDRVAALGGRLRIESPPGDGTVLAAELPFRSGPTG